MKKLIIALVLFALALPACQSIGAKAKVESTVDIMKITPSPDQKALNVELEKGTPSPEGAVVVFQRSGGFVGKTEIWSIYTDGKIVKDDGETYSVDAAKVTALLDSANTAGFFEMKSSSGIGNLSNCKDCYTYQLTISNNGQENSITAQDGSKGVPDAFWELIKQINTLITPPTQQ